MDLPPGTWLALTGAVLTSSVLSALVTTGIQWYRDHRKQAREEKTLTVVEAAKFIGVLEQYSLGIAIQIKNNEMLQDRFDELDAVRTQELNLPSPPGIPHELLLKHLPKEIAADIIWIETETYLSNMHMADVWDETFFIRDGVKQLHELLGSFGWRALDVADRLRAELKLPKMLNQLFEDPKYTLYAYHNEYMKRIQVAIDSRTAQG